MGDGLLVGGCRVQWKELDTHLQLLSKLGNRKYGC